MLANCYHRFCPPPPCLRGDLMVFWLKDKRGVYCFEFLRGYFTTKASVYSRIKI